MERSPIMIEQNETESRTAWVDLIVPSHDIPTSKRLDPPPRWEHHAVVYVPPFTPFPLDMLRYDGCWPVGSEDVRKIALTLDSNGVGFDEPQAIRVKRYGDRNAEAWTKGRWASFSVRLQRAGEDPPIEVYRLSGAKT